MADFDRLRAILRDTCQQLRKGDIFTGDQAMVEWAKAGDIETPPPGGVLDIYAMPRVDDPAFADWDKVDVHFMVIAVNAAKARERREELIAILEDWPEPDSLSGGPSYITLGCWIGDQGLAFELVALGKVLGIWDVITPATMQVTGPEADTLAGSGFIYCTGFRRTANG